MCVWGRCAEQQTAQWGGKHSSNVTGSTQVQYSIVARQKPNPQLVTNPQAQNLGKARNGSFKSALLCLWAVGAPSCIIYIVWICQRLSCHDDSVPYYDTGGKKKKNIPPQLILNAPQVEGCSHFTLSRWPNSTVHLNSSPSENRPPGIWVTFPLSIWQVGLPIMGASPDQPMTDNIHLDNWCCWVLSGLFTGKHFSCWQELNSCEAEIRRSLAVSCHEANLIDEIITTPFDYK